MSTRIDSAQRVIAAAPASVFAAWADPARLVRWLPPEGATGEVLDWEFRPGGAFRLRLTFAAEVGKTTGTTDDIVGRFVKIDPPGRLSHEGEFATDDPAFAGTMRLDWFFEAEGDATRARIEARGVPPGIDPAVHERALAESLAHLAAETEDG